VGTSGFAYKTWKGSFYAADLKDADMLRCYGTLLTAVEINNTFYRMPRRSVLQGWREDVPEGFRFVLKLSQRITHVARLKADAADAVRYFFETAEALGDRLGPVLVQLPPNMKKDAERLRGFFAMVPAGVRLAVEFRHASWLSPDVEAALGERGATRCVAEMEATEKDAGTTFATLEGAGTWGYVRLRKGDYGDADLSAWLERIRRQPWDEAWVFFKHEDVRGPDLARRFLALAGG
jgi:uncharacterized protein YecE (DUF72 family)